MDTARVRLPTFRAPNMIATSPRVARCRDGQQEDAVDAINSTRHGGSCRSALAASLALTACSQRQQRQQLRSAAPAAAASAAAAAARPTRSPSRARCRVTTSSSASTRSTPSSSPSTQANERGDLRLQARAGQGRRPGRPGAGADRRRRGHPGHRRRSASSARRSPVRPRPSATDVRRRPSMALIRPSATNATLTHAGLHRPSTGSSRRTASRAPRLADYLAKKGYKKVFVIDDLSDYGKGVADTVQKELEAKGGVHGPAARRRRQDHRLRRDGDRRSPPRARRRCSTAATTPRPALLAKALQRPASRATSTPATVASPSVFTAGRRRRRRRLVLLLRLLRRDHRPGGEGLHRGLQGDVQHRPVDVLAGGLRRHQRHDRGDQDGGQGRHAHPRRRSRTR